MAKLAIATSLVALIVPHAHVTTVNRTRPVWRQLDNNVQMIYQPTQRFHYRFCDSMGKPNGPGDFGCLLVDTVAKQCYLVVDGFYAMAMTPVPCESR